MMYLIHTKNIPIFEQLQLEEALLRTDTRNFFLINEGSSPAIVMGISGQVEELVDQQKTKEKNIPIIKRFSGGGTVIVDEGTIFTTFIGQKSLLHPYACYPEPILRWSEEVYKPAFDVQGFSLRENDFVIGEKKCGGNAQYIQKERWLLHTSFLYDFCQSKMELLLHPKKTPKYREGRSHTDFVCRLSEFFSDKEKLISQIKQEIMNRFEAIEIPLDALANVIDKEHRRSTTLVFS